MTPWRVYAAAARSSALGVTVAAAFLGGGVYIFTNASFLGLRKFKKRNQYYLPSDTNSKGYRRCPLVLSLEMQQLIWDVMDAANIPGHQRGLLNFFVARNGEIETIWAGSLYMRVGGAVGLPVYFNWPDASHFDFVALRGAFNVDLPMLPEEDKAALMECCTLSQAAKRYGIARILALMYNNEVFYSLIFFEFFLFSSLVTANACWIAKLPPAVNAIGFVGNVLAWRFINSYYRRKVYEKGVAAAIQLDPSVVAGAEEYYTKMKRLRELHQKFSNPSSHWTSALKRVYAAALAIRPPGISLEEEHEHVRSIFPEALKQPSRPLCREYAAAGKRIALPPVPVFPTAEAVHEPQKLLQHKGSDPEKMLISSSFSHLKPS